MSVQVMLPCIDAFESLGAPRPGDQVPGWAGAGNWSVSRRATPINARCPSKDARAA